MHLRLLVLIALAVTNFVAGVSARDRVKIAGSSTVLPYANIVAEEFGKTYSEFKTPIIESGGSSAGIKLFCQGLGTSTIDIVNASRRIREEEIKVCKNNGVENIIEISFGYDGIIIATGVNTRAWALKPKDVYLALAAKIPANGQMVKNPHNTWKDVNIKLPNWQIAGYIPGEKHGTREVFEERLLRVGCIEAGAESIMETLGVDKKNVDNLCIAVRKDGAAVDIDGDYNETLARLQSNNTGVGILSLLFYEKNLDKLKIASISGIKPSSETISSGEYPVSRPLYFYVKKDHIGMVPGLDEYLKFFISKRIIGNEGLLAEYGLVPMPVIEYIALLKKVKTLKTM